MVDAKAATSVYSRVLTVVVERVDEMAAMWVVEKVGVLESRLVGPSVLRLVAWKVALSAV
jgi:hypothetical protein